MPFTNLCEPYNEFRGKASLLYASEPRVYYLTNTLVKSTIEALFAHPFCQCLDIRTGVNYRTLDRLTMRLKLDRVEVFPAWG